MQIRECSGKTHVCGVDHGCNGGGGGGGGGGGVGGRFYWQNHKRSQYFTSDANKSFDFN